MKIREAIDELKEAFEPFRKLAAKYPPETFRLIETPQLGLSIDAGKVAAVLDGKIKVFNPPNKFVLINTGGATIEGSGSTEMKITQLKDSLEGLVHENEIVLFPNGKVALISKILGPHGMLLKSVDSSPLSLKGGDFITLVPDANSK